MMGSKKATLNFIHEWIRKGEAELASSNGRRIHDQSIDTQHRNDSSVNTLAPIAITGLSGYFPSCMDVQSFWDHIDTDESLITEIPKDRFDYKAYYDPSGKKKGSMRTKWGGFIPDITSFDPGLFNILPTEADEMDPRQRLLLMSTWRTLEDAGIDPLSLKKSNTGVFIGGETNEYAQLMRDKGILPQGLFNQGDSMIANRISYHFDFSGPSEFINTMCSSFAIALHRAVVALRAGNIDRAIVGAANIMLLPELYIALSQGDQLSTQKTVKSFGKGGDGSLRSEGVGTILVERWSDAKADHRHSYAIVKHVAVNYNGQGGMSLAAPTTAVHTKLIKTCYQEAEIDPEQLAYIEAQGMGLPVADIAEWTSMNRALTELCQERGIEVVPGYCRVSTLKPMAGHMNAASSLGALLKIIRSFQTRKIHKVLDYIEANEFCDMANTPCRIVTDTEPWADTTYPRLAAFHSFGAGGNNAHVLLEEYQPDESNKVRNKDTLPMIICLSARTKDQLKDMMQRLHDYLMNRPDTDLVDLSFTLTTGRKNFDYRCAMIAESIAGLIHIINKFNYGDITHPCYSGKQSTESVIDLSDQAEKLNIDNLAIEWSRGASIKNIELLYSNQRVQRLTGLPGYPFEKKRCWFQNRDLNSFEEPPHVISREKLAHEKWDKERIKKLVVRIFTNRFAIPKEQIEDKKEFSEYGLNSINATLFVREFNEKVPVTVAPKIFFNAANIADFSQTVFDMLKNKKNGEYAEVLFECLQRESEGSNEVKDDNVSTQTEQIEPCSHSAEGMSTTQLIPSATDPSIVCEISINENEFRDLVSGVMDPSILDGNEVTIHPSDKVTLFQYAHKIFEVFFYFYNVTKLDRHFQGHLIREIYTSGKVILPPENKLSIYPWAIPYELGSEIYHFIIKNELSSTLEIGLAYGLSALFICEAHHVKKDGFHIAIDPEQEKRFQNTALAQLDQANLSNYFEHVNLPDYLALPQLVNEQKEFDFIFIDGLHLFDYVLLDFFYADLLLKEQGYIAFDDSGAPGVSPVLDFVRKNRAYKEVPTSIKRLSIFQKNESDQRFLGDPSGFVECFGESADAHSVEDRPGRINHQELMSTFSSKFNELIRNHLFSIEKPWNFILNIKGARTTSWKFCLSRDRVESSFIQSQACPPPVKYSKEFQLGKRQRQKDEQPEIAGKDGDKVAIIGISARLPKSKTIDLFWENLLKEKSLFSEVPEDRWDWGKVGERHDHNYDLKTGGFIDDIYSFDSLRFNISPKDAKYIDPHQRLLLEETYKCIEDAGYTANDVDGSNTSVFIAIHNNSFQESPGNARKENEPYSIPGDHRFTANRISYFFNFTGTSEIINAACASTSVALCHAVKSLQNRECDMALVGAASIDFSITSTLGLSQLGIISKNNTCAPFNEDVSGLIPGEGVGAIMLKRLADAERQKDNIYGSIIGSEISHAGNLSGSFLIPNSISQVKLMERILKESRIRPDQIGYIEAHGTGGHGDSIELEAIKEVFGKENVTEDTNDVYIGSVKSYLGASDAASGIPQLIKVLLMMKNTTLIPTLNFQNESSSVSLKNSGLSILKEKRAWSAGIDDDGVSRARMAAINSYGLGGTTAFLLVEEYHKALRKGEKGVDGNKSFCVPLSASSQNALRKYAEQIHHYIIDNNNQINLHELAYTLQVGRRAYKYRIVFVVKNTDELSQKLNQFLKQEERIENCIQGTVDQEFSEATFRDEFAGNDFKKMGAEWVADGNLKSFVSLWIKGVKIDWEQLYPDVKPWRISAPSCPFAHRIHKLEVRAEQPHKSAVDERKKAVNERTHSSLDNINTRVLKVIQNNLDLEVGDFESDTPFSELGVDSLSVAKLTSNLESEFNIQLRKSDVFSYPNIGKMTDHIASLLKQNIPGEASRESIEAVDLKSKPGAVRSKQVYGQVTNHHAPPTDDDDIAIIGISLRVAGAKNYTEFWSNLKQGRCTISDIPKDRSTIGSDKLKTVMGGFVSDIDKFDPLFFSISPREAECMDPKHRVLLESAYAAIEDSGYSPASWNGAKNGIFIGVEESDYPISENTTITSIYGGTAPARIGYFLDTKGPLLALSTACSSSLVAICYACKSIIEGDSDYALAGGCSIISNPVGMLHNLSQLGDMLSPDGTCYAFDQRANGMVIGEGTGLVVLKRLSVAHRDNDAIYGIIKGCGTNYDGKTNGLTAPNGLRQRELYERVYKESGVEAHQISYIVAHGTGTSLGDPIECNALIDAHTSSSDKKQYCALTSVKTNIGHTLAASGVVNLVTAILALKNKQIPPTLNFETANRDINFEDSPFYVNTSLREWDMPKRYAAVSAFGYSGTNAHMVIEEYDHQLSVNSDQPQEDGDHLSDIGASQRETRQLSVEDRPVLIVLSAKNQDRLREYAKKLLIFVADHSTQTTDHCSLITDYLQDLAYTLQVGRQEMEERLGIIVHSIQEFKEKLEGFVEGREDVEDLFFGQVKRDKETLAVFAADEELQEAIDKWIQRGKYSRLLGLWVKGLIFDWNKLYGENKPQRISAPTYPFARERYWVEEKSSGFKGKLHPLVHENTSTLEEQRFSSTFMGDEFFLKDHQVKGAKVFPGVAYLEMAHEAVKQASGVLSGDHANIRLSNVAWPEPIIIGNDPQEVHIGLFPEENGEIAYEIYTDKQNAEEESLDEVSELSQRVHSQGVATLVSPEKMSSLNLTDLQTNLNQNSLSPQECYAAFKTTGVDHGPALQGLEKIYVGENAEGHPEILAELNLPASVSETKDQFTLHPSLLDSTLQASVGFVLFSKDPKSRNQKRSLPFALENLEVVEKCSESMWAWIRFSDGNVASDKVQKLDIDLCDEDGKICVKLRGLSLRALEGKLDTGQGIRSSPEESVEAPVGLITMSPVWNAIAIEKKAISPEENAQMMIVGGTQKQKEAIQQLYPHAKVLKVESETNVNIITKQLGEHDSIEHIVWIPPEPTCRFSFHPTERQNELEKQDIIQGQNQGVLQVFQIIKALLALGYGTKNLAWMVITTQTQAVRIADGANPTHAGIQGLIGSLAKEYPHWQIRLLDMEEDSRWPIEEMFSLPYNAQGNALAYRDREWFSRELLPVREFPEQLVPYKTGGVYVVIGGAGGIGEAWSKWMMEKYQAKIIWIGRREKDAIQNKLDSLAAIGPAPTYVQADAGNKGSLEKAYQHIKQTYSQINGVIHSACDLIDCSLENTDEKSFQTILSVNIDLSVHIAQVFEKESLDFLLFFSSITAFMKLGGFSGYSSGCNFKDAFVLHLSGRCSYPVKVMNWGYWRIGSQGRGAETMKSRQKQSGLEAIEPVEGMAVLEKLLNGPLNQVALIKTSKPMVMEGINPCEWMTIYPKTIPPGMVKKISVQIDELDPIKSAGGIQIPEMEGILCKLLWSRLKSLGLFREKTFIFSDLQSQGAFLSFYNRWMKEVLAIFLSKNYLKYDGNKYHVQERMDFEEAWVEWDQQKKLWNQAPDKRARVALIDACLPVLPDILTGKLRTTDVIFPNSSMSLIEGIYKGNVVADLFHDILGKTLVACIDERFVQDASSQLRILEVGAGIGGTTATILPKLQPYTNQILEYCYTDISKAFLMYAQEHYASQASYLKTQLFNVEKPIASQDFQANNYDIVIACNVLHATRNIRQTLRNAKALLRKGGILLLNEISSKSLFTHLTFGLLEGWWRYEDRLRIPGSPGLYPETWRRVLREEGFISTFFPAEKIHQLGQQIIVAISDGIVRQNQLPLKTVAKRFEPKAIPLSVRIKTSQMPLVQEKPFEKQKAIRRNIDVTDQMVEDYVKECIIEKLSESLKVAIDKIDVEESFSDYGLDSILGVNFVTIINCSLEIGLKTTDLFDYSSVKQLTHYILSNYKDQLITNIEQNAGQCKNKQVSTVNEGKRVFSSPKRFFNRTIESGIEGKTSISEQGSIAIIGMSGRFAQSETVTDFWEHLSTGRDLVKEVSRWDLSQHYSKTSENNDKYCNHGSFLENIDQFDPLFFKISPLEATYMDPQQRLFLEESWNALEDAGYTGESVAGKNCGIYVGCAGGDYSKLFSKKPPAQAVWGNEESIIPARIAYYLNLHGPAIAIDTACSSSLVAIHLACQSLWSKETEMSLAGGVCIQSTPSFYLACNDAGMLSPTGRCHTFDEKADGFVPGEGVGVIVMKRLKEVISDGDHIYGVIQGSGINQDGTTNGINAPSAKSQERLEKEVYDRFHINPQHIQMVEAHGTGTKLGDPIEYAALSQAFRGYTDKEVYCAIGSVKTNIGHLGKAAGVSGVIKVLLSLKYKKIPPSLHYQSGNSNIQFQKSPFYVNTKLQDWEAKENSRRQAAISAFGVSGTNAHMVIEEAPQTERRHSERPGYLIVLSARTSEQLTNQVRNLLRFCKEEKKLDPGNMSYTLLLGRKHWSHRLACVVCSIEELIGISEKWLKKGRVPQVYISSLSEGEVREQASLKRYGNQCIDNCRKTENAARYLEDLSMIADLYIQGCDLAYKGLFVKGYSRISLPTYPFSRERYWVNSDQLTVISKQSNGLGKLHPLVHENTSNFEEQRFSSTFTGDEFFLKDHQVKGEKMLPGVAYLEMVQEAIHQALGSFPKDHQSIQLKNVVWTRPIAVGAQPAEVHIGLFPDLSRHNSLEENEDGRIGEIVYEIYTDKQNAEEESLDEVPELSRRVHSQGVATLVSPEKMPSLNLTDLQTNLNQNSLSPQECYAAFKTMGVDHGPALQGLEKIYVGENEEGRPEILAKLTLPASVSETKDQFTLHPSLLDSALQASVGFVLFNKDPKSRNQKRSLPFALENLEVVEKCSESMWAWIRFSDGNVASDKVQKLDIDLCDEDGKICVKMRGFSTRVLEEDIAENPELIGTLMIKPVWKEKTVDPQQKLPEYTDRRVFLCGLSQESQGLQGKIPNASFSDLESNANTLKQRFEAYSLQLFATIQGILQEKPKGFVFLQVLVPVQGLQQVFSALSGLLKTAHLENAKMLGQVIAVKENESVEDLILKLEDSGRSPEDEQIRYEGEKRLVASFEEITNSESKRELLSESPWGLWKPGGVYLITGGAGGLGLIFAKEIAEKSKDSILILTGRSELSKEKKAKLRELESLGTKVEYKSVDVTDKKAVEALVQDIQNNFGGLNGIIHSAGVIKDNFILKKTKTEFKQVLAPKVEGVMNLDQATQDQNLDFFVLFSSGAGALGNAGQADYATANAFMDAFAKVRNSMRYSKERRGLTLSINWPLWLEGGMGVDKATETMMKESLGMVAMETFSGIETFYHSLTSNESQVMVIAGLLKRMQQKLLLTPRKVSKATTALTQINSEIDTDALFEKIQQSLRQTVAKLLKLRIEGLDVDTDLSEYGVDSITLTEIANRLNQKYQLELSPTVFFEYPTIGGFAKYLTEEHQEVFAEQFTISTQVQSVSGIDEVELEDDFSQPKRHSRFAGRRIFPASNPGISDPIAIVGLSGKFPMAQNLDEFWKNLQSGKDCIEEIPKDRWDWEKYYEEDPNKASEVGKSYCKWGGFLENCYEFDPLFFNIPPREAENIDPQERLFLEEAWKALEDAGYAPSSLSAQLRQRTGVFAGITKQGFNLYSLEEGGQLPATSFSSLVNRVSYHLNLQGPSLPIDTMCSSALVAIHEACEYLRHKKGMLAIAGAVNLYLHPLNYVGLSMAQVISKTRHSAAFEKGGSGFVPGEGVGAVILKPYSLAIQDRDSIYALIQGTAVNHGGKTNAYMTPNPNQQASVIQQALAQTNMDPRSIGYIESSANGSELADAIEMTALGKVFAKRDGTKGAYKIGSVKANIGHCEAASGMSQLSKVIFSLKHKTLVPTLVKRDLNSNIQFDQLPFQLQQEVSEWERVIIDGVEVPRRAGITSVGAGGVNAHIIVEEYISKAELPVFPKDQTDPVLFILSAKNQDRLEDYVKEWIHYLERTPNVDLERIAYTLQVGREAMPFRLAIVSSRQDDLLIQLKELRGGQENTETCYSGNVKTMKVKIHGAVDHAIKTKNLPEIAKQWILGNKISWKDLCAEKKLFRVTGLPAYPFMRKQCRSNCSLPPQKDSKESKTASQLFTKQNDFLRQLKETSSEERQNLLVTYLKTLIADLGGFDSISQLEPGVPMISQGLNSLMAIEVKKRLTLDLEIDISVLHIIDGSSITQLAKQLALALETNLQNKEPPTISQEVILSDGSKHTLELPVYTQNSDPSPQPKTFRNPYQNLTARNIKRYITGHLNRIAEKKLPYNVTSRILGWYCQQSWLKSARSRETSQLIKQLLPLIGCKNSETDMIRHSLMYNATRTWRFTALERCSPVQFNRWVRITGESILRQSYQKGNGIILVPNHSALIMLIIPVLRHLDFDNILGVGGILPALTKLVKKGRLKKADLDTVYLSNLIEQFHQCEKNLKQGRIIRIAPDGSRGTEGITLPFHGRNRVFWPSFAKLALNTGADVLPCFVSMNRVGEIHATFLDPLDNGSVAMSHDERVLSLMKQYVIFLEKRWTEDPGNIKLSHIKRYLDSPICSKD